MARTLGKATSGLMKSEVRLLTASTMKMSEMSSEKISSVNLHRNANTPKEKRTQARQADPCIYRRIYPGAD